MALNGRTGGDGRNGWLTADVDTTFPNRSAAQPPRSHATKGFKISTQKLPILKAAPIEEMTDKLGIAPPEMIFGDNFVRIDHEKSGWSINFNAFDALNLVDKTGEKRLKVAYSQEWHKSREDSHDIKEVVKPFDWSYSTDYKGTVSGPSLSHTSTPIPIELLKRPDPINFFDEVMLYEDELADNGIAMLSIKIRVMPSRLLLLQRFFMRLDNVLVRIRDTRVYVDFDRAQVIREYQAKEEDYDKLRERLATGREDVSAKLRDPNQIADMLPTVERTLEHVSLG